MTLKPLNGHILIEVKNRPETTKSGVMVVNNGDNRMEKAVALSGGEFIKKGDIIYFKSYSLSEVEEGGKIYGFIKEIDILAKG